MMRRTRFDQWVNSEKMHQFSVFAIICFVKFDQISACENQAAQNQRSPY
jgi:hypothetical protein